MLFLLVVSVSLGHILKRSKHPYLQEAGLTTIIGIVAGFILFVMKNKVSLGYQEKLTTHFNNLFMILLLPPIIFESGYNLEQKPFFKNLGTILMYSFLGTFISIFITSLLYYGISNWTSDEFHPAFNLRESFAYGSLISVTDPVSVLAIFKELNVNPNFYAIVFGESSFNDAVGIVMYETVKKLGDQKSKKDIIPQIWDAICSFTWIFLGSVVVGMGVALIVALILNKQT